MKKRTTERYRKTSQEKHFALNAKRHGRLSHFTYYAMLVLAVVLTAVTTSMPAAAASKAARGKDYVPADYTWTTQSKIHLNQCHAADTTWA